MNRFPSRLGARVTAVIAAFVVCATPAVAFAGRSIDGYRALRQERIAPGVLHEVYQRFGPQEAVHVARIEADAPYALRSVPASRFVNGGREPTSEICRRTKCLVAVNGDFWSGSDGLLGALVHHGELLRSPTQAHYQMILGPDGRSAGAITWHGKFVASDGSALALDGVNVPRKKNRIVLYSRAYARSTKTGHSGVELVLSTADKTGEPRLGIPARVRIEKVFVGRGNTKINEGSLVLSGDGSGAEALRALWHRAKNGVIDRRAEVRMKTSPDALESIGGTPVLVRDGRAAYDDAATSFVQSQHPRTIVGWTKTGDTLLVTVDGRQPGHSLGMTIPEASRLMIKLGAVDAINLDGGGSTTFVVRGNVLNKPSDRMVDVHGVQSVVKVATGSVLRSNVERPVASALVVVKQPVKPKVTAVKVAGTSMVRASDRTRGPSHAATLGRASVVVSRSPSRSNVPLHAGAAAAVAVALVFTLRSRRIRAARRR